MDVLATMLEKWKSSAEGKAAVAEVKTSSIAERKAMVEEIATLRAGLDRDLPAPKKAAEAAQAKVEKARAALRDAETGLRQAMVAVQNLKYRTNHQIAELERQLRDSAHPDVAAFVTWLADLWDRERRDWSWLAPTHAGAPMPAALRIAQIRDIQEQAEKLFFEPDPAEAEREMERLRSAVALPDEAAA